MATASGLAFDLLAPTGEQVRLSDIADTLARICRFNGALRPGLFYSVAQHSVFVAEIVLAKTDSPRLALGGLLHDAHETYWQDMCHPVEDALRCADHLAVNGRDALIAQTDMVIGAALGVDSRSFTYEAVRRADQIAVATELRDLVTPNARGPFRALPEPWPRTVAPWPVDFAEIAGAFTARFHELKEAAGG